MTRLLICCILLWMLKCDSGSDETISMKEKEQKIWEMYSPTSPD